MKKESQNTEWKQIPNAAPQVSLQVESLLAALQGTKGRDQLQAKLELKDKKIFRNLHLLPVLEKELIKMTQPDSPKSPTQQYKLKEKGNKYNER